MALRWWDFSQVPVGSGYLCSSNNIIGTARAASVDRTDGNNKYIIGMAAESCIKAFG